MVFLENDAFLTELTRLFQKSKTKGTGSVYVTMKRYDGKTKPEKNPNAPPLPKKIAAAKAKAIAASAAKKKKQQEPVVSGCLVRAKLQNRKISTVVPSEGVNRFQLSYCSVLRQNMDALKKVKKSKSKSKATS